MLKKFRDNWRVSWHSNSHSTFWFQNIVMVLCGTANFIWHCQCSLRPKNNCYSVFFACTRLTIKFFSHVEEVWLLLRLSTNRVSIKRRVTEIKREFWYYWHIIQNVLFWVRSNTNTGGFKSFKEKSYLRNRKNIFILRRKKPKGFLCILLKKNYAVLKSSKKAHFSICTLIKFWVNTKGSC